MHHMEKTQLLIFNENGKKESNGIISCYSLLVVRFHPCQSYYGQGSEVQSQSRGVNNFFCRKLKKSCITVFTTLKKCF